MHFLISDYKKNIEKQTSNTELQFHETGLVCKEYYSKCVIKHTDQAFICIITYYRYSVVFY